MGKIPNMLAEVTPFELIVIPLNAFIKKLIKEINIFFAFGRLNSGCSDKA